jgi:transcriptional regulator with XRE-family HTH domain
VNPDEKQQIQRLFGEEVRRHRTRIGISQEALAARAGLDRTYVGGIERGERNPALVNIARLSRALGVPAMELLRPLQ